METYKYVLATMSDKPVYVQAYDCIQYTCTNKE